MKLKKYSYLLVFILMLSMGIKGANAKELPTLTADINISDVMLFTDVEYDVNCEDIFDSGGENSIRNLINEILEYPKWIVPIIVIGLGTTDLAKAVISAKEDEMRKAQKTFVKRLFLGVVIFFVPVIVNFVMDIADIVWETTTCRL